MVEVSQRVKSFDFLVDTGADSTLLEPADAYTLLGDEYLQIDFDNDPHRETSTGVGGLARSVARPARFDMLTDDGNWIVFNAPIYLAEPVFSGPEKRGNWDSPNLLGRDLLRFFEIHLDYYPAPELHLWYDEDAAYEELQRLRRWYDYLLTGTDRP